MAPYLCGVDPVVGNNTLVVLTTIFGGGFEVWVCDSWYYGIQPWRLWALNLLEEGGVDFCVFDDDFSILSWVVGMIFVMFKKLIFVTCKKLTNWKNWPKLIESLANFLFSFEFLKLKIFSLVFGGMFECIESTETEPNHNNIFYIKYIIFGPQASYTY